MDTPDPGDYHVLVSSPLNMVQVFDSEGAYLTQFPIGSDPYGADRRPGVDMAADELGYTWVLEGSNSVSTYRPDGLRQQSWEATYSGAPIAGMTMAPGRDVVVWFNLDSECLLRRYTYTGVMTAEQAFRGTPLTTYRIAEVAVAPDNTYYVLLHSQSGQYLVHLLEGGRANLPLSGDVRYTMREPASLAIAVSGVLWLSDRPGRRLFTLYYGAFRDVALWSWAYQAAQAVVAASIVTGYKDGTYRPAAIVNRDQMAVYLARAVAGGEGNVPTGPEVATFSDVPTGYWAYRHVEYAVVQGIVQGYLDGSYRPSGQVNRGQMAAFIARAMAGGEDSVPDNGCTTPPFDDIACDYWSRKHIEYIKAAGVTVGYADGKYHPEYLVTREQMAVYIARAYGLL
jgi:hypothetical protein